MIRHILKKDWTLLWPLVALVTAIQVGFEWSTFKAGFFSDNPVARELVGLLSAAWTVGVLAVAVAVVHEDPIPGAEQDWLIRPLSRADLLLAKLAFVAISVCVPMLVVNLTHALALGFPLGLSLGIALYKELFVFACLLLPVMALAAVARNTSELLVFGACLVVLYAAALSVSALTLGSSGCPTCDTSIVWTQHLLQHIGVLAGAIVILVLQYFRRKTELSRAVAVVGVLMLVSLQLPWRLAFAAQRWMTGAPDAAISASIAVDVAMVQAGLADPASDSDSASHRSNPGRGAAQALMSGDVGAAVESLQHVSHPHDAPVALRIPLRLSGLTPDEFLFADRTQVSVSDDRGRVLYRGSSARGSFALIPDPNAGQEPGLVQQPVELPRPLYDEARTRPLGIALEYSLTLMAAGTRHRISAVDGELRTPETGLCRTKAMANEILMVCKQLGRAPVCYGATLYAPDGRHNPEVLQCTPDYRPYLPSLGNILTVSAVELPTHDASGLAHYSVGGSELSNAYVALRTYAPRAHFTRSVPVFRLQTAAPVGPDAQR